MSRTRSCSQKDPQRSLSSHRCFCNKTLTLKDCPVHSRLLVGAAMPGHAVHVSSDIFAHCSDYSRLQGVSPGGGQRSSKERKTVPYWLSQKATVAESVDRSSFSSREPIRKTCQLYRLLPRGFIFRTVSGFSIKFHFSGVSIPATWTGLAQSRSKAHDISDIKNYYVRATRGGCSSCWGSKKHAKQCEM